MPRPEDFAGVPALLMLDEISVAGLAEVVQKTYYNIATKEWSQTPGPNSPYVVPTQAELPDDLARRTNEDAAQAFLKGLEALVILARAANDGEWFLKRCTDNVAQIREQGVFLSDPVEFALHSNWARHRVRSNPSHKNLMVGYQALPNDARQYDRRIAYALWNAVQEQIYARVTEIKAKYAKE